MVFLPWWWNNLDGQWDDPLISHCLERLASFSRLIVFDMRGVGLSDPASLQDLPTLERWMNDAKAVLDAVGSSEAMVIGHGDGGLVAMLLAATYPARTSGLVLVDSYAPFAAEDGYEGWDPEGLDRVLAGFEDFWGTGNPGWVGMVAPSQAHSEEFRDQLARLERQSVSPGAAAALQLTIGHLDVRPILAAISTPTCSPTRVTVTSRPTSVATSPSTSPERRWSNSKAPIISTGSAAPMRRSTRSSDSRPGHERHRDRSGCWPRCSSPTWPARPVWPPKSVISVGGRISRHLRWTGARHCLRVRHS